MTLQLTAHQVWAEIARKVTLQKDFITYGVGIPLMQMRFPEKTRGRAAVAA